MMPANHPAVDGGWREAAACANPIVDPEFMYPHDSDDPTVARAVCQECPVRHPCLEDGLDDEFGVWGGFTPTERVRLRRNLPTEPITRRLALARAAYLGPFYVGVADRRHPQQEGRK